MTWDMVTAGPEAGTLIRPLVYTETEDEATRVKLWVQLATLLGSYLLATNEGLDHRRMLLSEVDDDERAALVRALLLDDERVATVDDVRVTTDLGFEGGPRVEVEADYTTITGTPDTIGANIGA